MYWQVYLHKTVVSAESLLINVLKRAKDLVAKGVHVFSTPTLQIFLENNFTANDFEKNITIKGRTVLNWYSQLDDNDIIISVKEWQQDPDFVLSYLAKSLNNRKLFKTELPSTPVSINRKEKILELITQNLTHEKLLSPYLLISGELTNSAYNNQYEKILVLDKAGKTKDLQQASDINLSALTKTVRKYFLCFPKELDIYKL